MQVGASLMMAGPKELLSYHELVNLFGVSSDLSPQRPFFVEFIFELASPGPAARSHVDK